MKRLLAIGAGLSFLGCAVSTVALAEVSQNGAVTSFIAPLQTGQAASTIDFANAKPMPLPGNRTAALSQADALRQATRLLGNPAASAGDPGNGQESPIQLVPPRDLKSGGMESQEFGTSNHPFTTNRVNALSNQTSRYYPFRPSGKLFFNIGSSTFVCSASLIKRGVVVTAAHCVANFGASQFYSNWTFVPAFNNGTAPYGTWTTATARVLTSYFNGTGPCAVSGVVCRDDVAVLTENTQSGAYPGTTTGWHGYGVNGYGFNPSAQVLINQLGYPVSHDSGQLNQRNDSQGFRGSAAGFSSNTIIGSLMTGGSSGGPWLVNLGIAPVLSGTSFGSAAARNIVVGVTSWGYTNTAVKQQGASPFLTGNITTLVNAACAATPAAC